MIGWIATVFSLLGIILNARKSIWSWPLWVIADILWMVVSYQADQWAMFTVWTIYGVFSVYGWWKWSA